MTLDVGSFASVFSPQVPPNEGPLVIKDLLDVFTFAIGIGSAFSWNVCA
jgi:hypothetical protein